MLVFYQYQKAHTVSGFNFSRLLDISLPLDQFDPRRLRRWVCNAVCYAGSITSTQSQRRHRVRASHARGESQSASILESISMSSWATESKVLQTTQHEIHHGLSLYVKN